MEEIIKYKGFNIEIRQSTDPSDPREWDNNGIMICFHKKYNLGDKNDIDGNNFDSWDEMEEYLEREEKAICIIPLRMYDHGGITISASTSYPYNDRWDSGQIGFIYTTLKQLHYMGHDWKKITKRRMEKIGEWLLNEIDVYDQYVKGKVFNYNIEDVDSCCGFYGYDHKKSGLLDAARESIDFHIIMERKKHFKTLKGWIKSGVSIQYRVGIPKTVTLRD